MIFPDPKKSATVILSKGKLGSEKSMPVNSESEVDPSDEGLKSAAEDVLMAVDQKSPHDLMLALKSFFQMCDEDDSEESEEGFHLK